VSRPLRHRHGFTSILVGLTLLVVACKEDDPGDGGSSGSAGTSSGGPVVLADNECKDLAPIHATPACDGCTRDVCCSVVLDCDRSRDCRALLNCLLPCKKGNLDCSAKCRAEHEPGGSMLPPINTCAEKNCPIPCGTAFIEEG